VRQDRLRAGDADSVFADDEGKAGRDRQEQERRDREREETARRQRRRLIQEVKDVAVSESFGGWGGLPEKFRAQVLQEVERALSPLDLDELPRDELLIHARAARDKIVRAVEKARDERCWDSSVGVSAARFWYLDIHPRPP
jgi:hypothetical protein